MFQSQNDYIFEWLPRKGEYLSELLQAEGRPANPTCLICRQQEGIWKCLDCLGRPTHCRTCSIQVHSLLPFHRVERWNGAFFKPAWLWQAGLIIHLGHSGVPCPNAIASVLDTANAPDDSLDHNGHLEELEFPKGSDDQGNPLLIVVDRTGIHTVAIQWCSCLAAPSHDLQLLQFQMFPASFRSIKTAFTFQVLDDFLTDNRECKTSAMNYFSKLRRLTTNTFPHTVPVSLHVHLDCQNHTLSRTDTAS